MLYHLFVLLAIGVNPPQAVESKQTWVTKEQCEQAAPALITSINQGTQGAARILGMACLTEDEVDPPVPPVEKKGS